MRRNTSSQSDSCWSRCTTTSRISNGAWLNGLDRPRTHGATTASLIDPGYRSLCLCVAAAEVRGSNPLGRATKLFALPLRRTLVQKCVQAFAKIPAHIAHQDQVLAF